MQMPKHLAVKDTDGGLNLALPALEPLVYPSLAMLRLPLCKRGHCLWHFFLVLQGAPYLLLLGLGAVWSIGHLRGAAQGLASQI